MAMTAQWAAAVPASSTVAQCLTAAQVSAGAEIWAVASVVTLACLATRRTAAAIAVAAIWAEAAAHLPVVVAAASAEVAVLAAAEVAVASAAVVAAATVADLLLLLHQVTNRNVLQEIAEGPDGPSAILFFKPVEYCPATNQGRRGFLTRPARPEIPGSRTSAVHANGIQAQAIDRARF